MPKTADFGGPDFNQSTFTYESGRLPKAFGHSRMKGDHSAEESGVWQGADLVVVRAGGTYPVFRRPRFCLGCAGLATLLLASSPSIQAEEIARFDNGPFAGKGYPFSESARAGDLLFLAGHVGQDANGKLLPRGIQAEAEQLMLNIDAALGRRGLTMDQVVKCTVFLADIDAWGAFNEVFKEHFSPPYPARSAIAASGLVGNARVGMECIAGYPG